LVALQANVAKRRKCNPAIARPQAALLIHPKSKALGVSIRLEGDQAPPTYGLGKRFTAAASPTAPTVIEYPV
jgi:hypothetical protein